MMMMLDTYKHRPPLPCPWSLRWLQIIDQTMFFTELHCNYHHSDRYDCWYGRGGGWSTCKLRSTQQYIHGFVNTFDNFDFYCLQNNFMFTKLNLCLLWNYRWLADWMMKWMFWSNLTQLLSRRSTSWFYFELFIHWLVNICKTGQCNIS